MKRLEKEFNKQLDADLCGFEADVFKSGKFSSIQKYLKSIWENQAIPQTLKYTDQSTELDREKAKFFNEFFSVFLILNWFRKQGTQQNHHHENENQNLDNLDLNKSTGPDNNGNIILKMQWHTVKINTAFFKTILNKGVYPEVLKISQV